MDYSEILKADYLTIEQQIESILSKAFGIDVFSYNSEITDDVINVLRESKNNEANYTGWYQDIAKKYHKPENYIELIKYIICNNDHAEYGTSPRGAWLTKKGEDLLQLIEDLDKKREPR